MYNRPMVNESNSNNIYVRICSILCFAYLYAALGLVGVQGLCRLALVFCILLLGTLLIGIMRRQLRVGNWIILPLMFYTYLVALSFGGESGDTNSVGMLFTVWIGSTAVGLAVQNGVKKLLIIYAGVCAVLSSFIAHLCGFEAYNEYTSEETGVILTTRFSGLMGNGNTLAITAIAFTFLAIILLYRNCILKTVLFACSVYATVLSGSRKGLIGCLVLVAIFAIYPLVYMPSVRWKYFLILMVIVIGLGTFVVRWVLEYSDDFEATKRTVEITSGHEESFEERKDFIGIGWDLFLKKPIFGYGLDSFRVVSSADRYSHNNYIELLVGGGLIFLILFYLHHFIITRIGIALPSRTRYWILSFILYLMIQDMACVTYSSRTTILVLILLLVRMREHMLVFNTIHTRLNRWFMYIV